MNFNLGTDGWQYFGGRVGNWIVDKGEAGIGSIYNKRWGNTVVFELDSTENQVYKYILDLSGGLYELSFDWAAREGENLLTSQISVRFNGEDIGNFAPTDYEVNRFSKIVRALPQLN